MARDANNSVRLECERRLGISLGTIFSEPLHEVTWLHHVWQEFSVVFGSAEQIEIANEAAGGFLFIVQKALWEGVLLHIARLTDPPQSVGKSNLTLRRLEGLVAPEIRAEISSLTADLRLKAEFARDWRMRWLAHTDLDLALGNASEPLASASRDMVDAALVSMALLLNEIDRHYRDTTTFFQGIAPLNGGPYVDPEIRSGREKESHSGKKG